MQGNGIEGSEEDMTKGVTKRFRSTFCVEKDCESSKKILRESERIFLR